MPVRPRSCLFCDKSVFIHVSNSYPLCSFGRKPVQKSRSTCLRQSRLRFFFAKAQSRQLYGLSWTLIKDQRVCQCAQLCVDIRTLRWLCCMRACAAQQFLHFSAAFAMVSHVMCATPLHLSICNEPYNTLSHGPFQSGSKLV